ncbi:MAG: HlyD family efflux transporter periplasmic adaptor subunit [Chloroflexota bacterium]
MSYRSITFGIITVILLLGLAACSQGPSSSEANQELAATPTIAPPTEEPEEEEDISIVGLSGGISANGEVKAAREADLVFSVTGTVGEVFVEEGEEIEQGQLLIELDKRSFDQQVRQAEAALSSARSQQDGLYEGPRAADVNAANEQIRSAQTTLTELQNGPKPTDVQTAQASLEQSRINLESTRNQLSLSKTQAEAQVTTATESLVSAQATYAQAKSNWEFVQDTGQNPQQPVLGVDQQGEEIENDVVDSQRESFYAQFVQAEAALRQAEQGVESAVVAAEESRKAELVGIQTAEQQVVQAEAALEDLLNGADPDQIASAEAQVASAQSQLDQLTRPPTNSAAAQSVASVEQAEASLESALLNRENAELRSPFDGVVAAINVDPGELSSAGNPSAVTIVDMSSLHVDVQISDVDISQIQMNQEAQVFVEGIDRVFNGEVTYIAPTATVNGNIRTYLVRVTVDERDGLRPGMSARVELGEAPEV